MPTETPVLPRAEKVLYVLHYFRIFFWPLTAGEIRDFYPDPIERSDLEGILSEMVRKQRIFHIGPYYLVENAPHWIEARHEYTARAEQYMSIARRMARVITGFPFIRAVFISGSLSKHAVGPNGDVDFFLITTPNRLWLARTLLVLFKRFFLFNSHKYFCINYLIDTEHLEIPEKNIYTATEIVTLLPIYGAVQYHQFRTANAWTGQFLPNFPLRDTTAVPPERTGLLKKTTEYLLGGRVGEWLDVLSMRFTMAFWRRKFRHLSDADFNAAIRSHRYESKYHPLHYQKKVLQELKRTGGKAP
jgi:hypothetical protein